MLIAAAGATEVTTLRPRNFSRMGIVEHNRIDVAILT